MKRGETMCAGVAVAALVLAAAVTSTTFASVVTRSAETLTVADKAGQRNQVRVTDFPGNSVLIHDAAGISGPVPKNCMRRSPTTVRCLYGSILDDLRMVLSAGRDSLILLEKDQRGDTRFSISAGTGNDLIQVFSADDLMTFERILVTAGAGNDVLRLRLDGIGPLKLFMGAGQDFFKGGPQRDRVFGGGGADTLRGLGGNDKLFGLWADDTLNGGAGDDRLTGGRGKDKCLGRRGADLLTTCEYIDLNDPPVRD